MDTSVGRSLLLVAEGGCGSPLIAVPAILIWFATMAACGWYALRQFLAIAPPEPWRRQARHRRGGR